MKLRIEIEKKNYEVSVEFLEDAHNVVLVGGPGTGLLSAVRGL